MSGSDNWEEHWDRYSQSSSENPAQAYRRRLILKLLGTAPDRVLDLGCGQGDLLAEIAHHFPAAQLGGVELSRAGVAAAQRKVPGARLHQHDLLLGGCPPPDLDGWALVAICSEVLEHVDDPVTLLKNASPYMAAGAKLIVTVPAGPLSAFDRHIGHRTHYRPETLRALLEEAGFAVTSLERAGWPFFNLYRMAVVARGQKLVEEVSGQNDWHGSWAARRAIGAFRALFRCNRCSSRWGWQLVAVATRR